MTTRLEAIEARLARAKNADGDYDCRLYGDRGDPSAPSDLAWAVARIKSLEKVLGAQPCYSCGTRFDEGCGCITSKTARAALALRVDAGEMK